MIKRNDYYGEFDEIEEKVNDYYEYYDGGAPTNAVQQSVAPAYNGNDLFLYNEIAKLREEQTSQDLMREIDRLRHQIGGRPGFAPPTPQSDYAQPNPPVAPPADILEKLRQTEGNLNRVKSLIEANIGTEESDIIREIYELKRTIGSVSSTQNQENDLFFEVRSMLDSFVSDHNDMDITATLEKLWALQTKLSTIPENWLVDLEKDFHKEKSIVLTTALTRDNFEEVRKFNEAHNDRFNFVAKEQDIQNFFAWSDKIIDRYDHIDTVAAREAIQIKNRLQYDFKAMENEGLYSDILMDEIAFKGEIVDEDLHKQIRDRAEKLRTITIGDALYWPELVREKSVLIRQDETVIDLLNEMRLSLSLMDIEAINKRNEEIIQLLQEVKSTQSTVKAEDVGEEELKLLEEIKDTVENLTGTATENVVYKELNNEEVTEMLQEIKEKIAGLPLEEMKPGEELMNSVNEIKEFQLAIDFEALKAPNEEIVNSLNDIKLSLSLLDPEVIAQQNEQLLQSNEQILQSIEEIKDTVAASEKVELDEFYGELGILKAAIAALREDLEKDKLITIKKDPDYVVLNAISKLRTELSELKSATPAGAESVTLDAVAAVKEDIIAMQAEANKNLYEEVAALRGVLSSVAEAVRVKADLSDLNALKDALIANVTTLKDEVISSTNSDTIDSIILEDLSNIKQDIYAQRESEEKTLAFVAEIASQLEKKDDSAVINEIVKIKDEIKEEIAASVSKNDVSNVSESLEELKNELSQIAEIVSEKEQE